MPDNYELQLEYARELFLKFDQKKIIGRLSLHSDAQAMYISFLGENWRIDRQSGLMRNCTDGKNADFCTAMSIYDYICRDTPLPYVTGRKAPINSRLHHAHPGVGESSIHHRHTKAFDAEPEKFAKACRQLGGRPYPRGDHAYEFTVFEGLQLVLQLWLSDDEFPASLTLLWDEHVLDVLMYETAWYAAGSLLDKVLRKMKSYL